MSEIPSDLTYTAEHEWVQRVGDDTVKNDVLGQAGLVVPK